jgi:hypothetical protein
MVNYGRNTFIVEAILKIVVAIFFVEAKWLVGVFVAAAAADGRA